MADKWQDILGRFRQSPQNPAATGPVNVENIAKGRGRSESVVDRTGQGVPFAHRTPQIDPAAARLAARALVHKMDPITNAPGHKLANESPEARENRVTRIARTFMEDATGEEIQRVGRMTNAEIQDLARRQQRGENTPGLPPVRY